MSADELRADQRSAVAVARLVGDLGQAAVSAFADLRDAVEIMDTKITPFGEREDGTVQTYIVADSTWHRVLAIAQGSTSEKARQAIDLRRIERSAVATELLDAVEEALGERALPVTVQARLKAAYNAVVEEGNR